MEFDFQTIIALIILIATILFITLKLNNLNIKETIVKFIVSCIILGSYLYISYLLTTSFIRYILFVFVGSIIISRIYKINIVKSICTLFFSWFIFLISECIFSLIIGLFFKNIHIFFGTLVSNITISIMALSIFSIKKIRNKINSIISKMVNSEKTLVFIAILILALSFSIMLYINYFNSNNTVNFILSLIIIITQGFIMILLFLEKNITQTIQCEYNALVNNFNEYEKMLEYQRISNHENKNQLLVIKGMIEKEDSNTIEYINSIVKEQSEPNESFLYQTNKIPSGGLRGLIYYKCLLMKEKKINVELNVHQSVRKLNFEKIDITLNKNICKIIGVFIDNAIEAVSNIENEKNIKIELKYENNLLEISISNNFVGILDISNIDKKGYTTKGNGHGYGLSLVKEIVNKNPRLHNKREIKSNVFIQNMSVELS